MSQKQSSEIIEKIQNLLSHYAQEVNEYLQFSQMESPLDASRFVQVLVLGWLKEGQASLNRLAHSASDLGLQISASALHERMNSRAVMLLAGVLNRALEDLRRSCPLALQRLKSFQGIYITDSSQIALPAALSELFKGNQGNAMLKMQVTWDYLHGNLAALELVDGKSADQNCRLHLQNAQKGSLQLFDLGYFKQEYLAEIANQEAYFVSRYKAKTGLYKLLGESFDLVAHLKALSGTEADLDLRLGGRVKLALRLLARRLSPSAAAAKKRKARKLARKQGQTLSAAYLYLLNWEILLTNLPATDWSLSEVFDLYAIRFQIEWLFRIWKDQLDLDKLGNWRIERLLCQLYAHFLAALLSHLLTAAWRWGDFEYSFAKAVMIIQDAVKDLLRALADSLEALCLWLGNLERDFHRFARKNKRRKAPSTLQTIYNWDPA